MPETRRWWGDLYKDYLATGVDGVWNDMNEPAVFDVPDGTMPPDNLHRGGGDLPPGPHLSTTMFSGMLMAHSTREGILKARPDKQPFVLTRSNYLGGQRYAATWTGDNRAEESYLRQSVPMSINLGLSGQPLSGPDIGGYEGQGTPELYANWMAVGAFTRSAARTRRTTRPTASRGSSVPDRERGAYCPGTALPVAAVPLHARAHRFDHGRADHAAGVFRGPERPGPARRGPRVPVRP